MYLKKLISIIFLVFLFQLSYSQGIRGIIKDEDGERLSYATLYIEEISSGTVANSEGFFELRLSEGEYTLKFRYSGYNTIEQRVKINSNWQELEITMSPQTLILREIVASSKAEDPAYGIMRKAITKSKYHLQRIDKYEAEVYIKGKGRVIDIPFFLKKELAKEGLDSTTLFISESVSMIEYERPNTYNERVISVFKSGEENATSPNSFIFGSFYEDQVANSISPLAKNAFSYYRFSYESAFMEEGKLINKILVTPRVKAPNVFTGYIHIVEDEWSIHSLALSTTVEFGVLFSVEQQYAPINAIWMPVSQKIRAEGKIFGLSFEYDYLASMSNYKITLNPDMEFKVSLLDEKSQKEEIRKLKEDDALVNSLEKLSETTDKKVARKELRKMMKEYEKEELKKSDEPEVVSERNRTIDSLAYQRTVDYWSEKRPIPLSEKEVEGYKKQDSLARVGRIREEGGKDSTKTGKFDYGSLIMGKKFRLADGHHLDVKSPIIGLNFNTVEGLNVEMPLIYTYSTKNKRQFEVKPLVRYSSLRNHFSGYISAEFRANKTHRLNITGGQYIAQYNEEGPIDPLFNTFTTLFLSGNFMKIYEQEFIRAEYDWNPNDKWKINTYAEYGNRTELRNRSDFEIINYPWREHTSNIPSNNELESTSFDPHAFFIMGFGLEWQPFLKYRVRNGVKTSIKESSPKFSLDYKKGIPLLGSAVNYDLVQAGYNHKIKIGTRGVVDINVHAGKFLNDQSMFFPDFKHFPGNLTPIQFDNPAGKYRRLDYYLYSTADWFVSPHIHYQFRKLFLTQIMELRYMGIKENLLVNLLYTPQSGIYQEFGYVIDNIYRLFSLEMITSFQNSQYVGFGMRLGISTTLKSLINNN